MQIDVILRYACLQKLWIIILNEKYFSSENTRCRKIYKKYIVLYWYLYKRKL